MLHFPPHTPFMYRRFCRNREGNGHHPRYGIGVVWVLQRGGKKTNLFSERCPNFSFSSFFRLKCVFALFNYFMEMVENITYPFGGRFYNKSVYSPLSDLWGDNLTNFSPFFLQLRRGKDTRGSIPPQSVSDCCPLPPKGILHDLISLSPPARQGGFLFNSSILVWEMVYVREA